MITRKKRLAVVQIGARMHYAIPRILSNGNNLSIFITDTYMGNKRYVRPIVGIISKFVPVRIIQRLRGRYDSGIPSSKVRSSDLYGVFFSIHRALVTQSPERDKMLVALSRRLANIFGKVDLAEVWGVWGFNGASIESFRLAQKEGKICILEQTILPKSLERELLAQENSKWRGWAAFAVQSGSRSVLENREAQEWTLADAIVCGSSFVRDGLVRCGVEASKIHVVPYGVEASRYTPKLRSFETERRKLRVLFVGEVGLRKGAPYLLSAAKEIGSDKIEVRFAGKVSLSREILLKFRDCATFLGHIPRDNLACQYEWADVFVLPSIVEGSATVTYEAVLSGLPVITTPNSGSLTKDGITGKLIEAGSVSSLVDALRDYISTPNLVETHSKQAIQMQYEANFERYESDLLCLITSLSSN